MHAILTEAAELDLLLPRSMAQLYENVREFFVALNEAEEVVGVCGLSVVWANLAEVVALAVHPSQRGKGVGRQLVEACVEDARQLGIRRCMTLTLEAGFFERLGFERVERQQLPLKVWSACVECPKNQHCDEIAMVRVLEDVVELQVARPVVPAAGGYVVPTVLSA